MPVTSSNAKNTNIIHIDDLHHISRGVNERKGEKMGRNQGKSKLVVWGGNRRTRACSVQTAWQLVAENGDDYYESHAVGPDNCKTIVSEQDGRLSLYPLIWPLEVALGAFKVSDAWQRSKRCATTNVPHQILNLFAPIDRSHYQSLIVFYQSHVLQKEKNIARGLFLPWVVYIYCVRSSSNQPFLVR